jgi:NTE family protein
MIFKSTFSLLLAAVYVVMLQAPTALAATARPKVGLALGGGGTRGLAHIAVLREMEKQGIQIDYIAGTSMGAIVGGLYCAGMSTQQIEKLFRNKSLLRAYDTVPIPLRVAVIPIFAVPHLFGYHPYDGLYKGNKFATFITKSVAPERRDIECARIPFCAVASNLLDGKAHTIKTGNLGRALQASSAIPGLRRPVDWQGKLFVDGGIVDNIPVKQCREMGADYVIAVDVDEHLGHLQSKAFRKIGSVSYRCVNMHLSKLDEPAVREADMVIHPDVDGIGLLSRNMKDIDKCLNAGEEAAKHAIPIIQQQLNGSICDAKHEGKS